VIAFAVIPDTKTLFSTVIPDTKIFLLIQKYRERHSGNGEHLEHYF
jgi:hypothetical protein